MLLVNYVNCNSMDDVAENLTKKQYENISISSWGDAPSEVSACFKILHCNNAILLEYNITENEMLARYNNHLDPVYQDSCVEMFILFGEDSNFYNFEFNCFGSCLSAWGPNRDERQTLPVEVLKQIETRTVINRGDSGGLNWHIYILIPVNTFVHHDFKTIAGVKARANFYKCGDNLVRPHFLSWKKIKTTTPDFHQPLYFGELCFE